MTRIFAIDPGPVRSAFVIWDGASILDHGIIENDAIIKTLKTGLNLDAAAIEMIASYGMSVGAEIFETCVWIGRFIERWMQYACMTAIRIPRKEVCVHLCGSARANDSNIRQALIDRLGKPGTKKTPGVTHGIHADEWAALAVAVTIHDRMRCGGYSGRTA